MTIVEAMTTTALEKGVRFQITVFIIARRRSSLLPSKYLAVLALLDNSAPTGEEVTNSILAPLTGFGHSAWVVLLILPFWTWFYQDWTS